MVSAALTLNDLNDDVLYEICSFVNVLTTDFNGSLGPVSLKNLSLVNKHFRELSAPILFRNVRIIGPAGKSRMMLEGDWIAARTAIAVLQNSLVRYIRNFKFDIYAARHPEESGTKQDFEQLVKFLVRMPQLRKLVLYVPLLHASTLESAFEVADILLPSVNTLVVNPLCVFIINKCPNLEAASTHPIYHRLHISCLTQRYKITLPKAPSLAKKLRRFEAEGLWCVDDLHALATVAPKLRWLGMTGTPHASEADPTLIQEKLTALSRFENLERLDIAGSSELGFEFEPPWRINTYMGLCEAELQWARESRCRTEDMVARAAFSSCASLKEVWVGGCSKAQAVRGKDGNIDKVIWSRGELITGSIAK